MKAKIDIEISLSNSDKIVLVSVEDLELVHNYTWILSLNRYAQAWIKNKSIFMHKLIMKPLKGFVVHHKDDNGLNNTRDNLIITTISNNLANMPKTRGTSKYKGVHWDKNRNKWAVHLTVNTRSIHGGRFNTEEEAALKAKELYSIHGGNARQD